MQDRKNCVLKWSERLSIRSGSQFRLYSRNGRDRGEVVVFYLDARKFVPPRAVEIPEDCQLLRPHECSLTPNHLYIYRSIVACMLPEHLPPKVAQQRLLALKQRRLEAAPSTPATKQSLASPMQSCLARGVSTTSLVSGHSEPVEKRLRGKQGEPPNSEDGGLI